MERSLKNPRARRMLNMTLQPSCKSSRNATDDCCTPQEPMKKLYDIEMFSIAREKPNTEVNITKGIVTRDKKEVKNYNERDDDDEDFSPEPSEYVPSPNREIRSDTPSTTSSFGGNSFFIDKMINLSNIRSPSTISNLSVVFDNVDFVASPSAIYKVSSARDIPQEHEGGPENNLIVYNRLLEPVYLGEHSKNVSSNSNNDAPLSENRTLTPDDMDITLKLNESIMECNERINGLSSWTSSNNVTLDEDNLNKQNTPLENNSNDTGIVQSVQILSSILNNQNNNMIPEPDMTEQITSKDDENKELSRKRKCNKNEWKDNKNKKLKNSGQAYEGCRSKKSYSAKTIGPVCSCRKRCGEKFTSEQREGIFKAFYKLQSHELQWQYITRRIISNPIKRLTLDRKNNRTQTLNYSFPLDGCNIPVCKIYFLNTLKISEQVVYTALEKVRKDESLIDERGTHLNRPHRMSAITKESIMKHINLFPAVESHYIRNDSKRKYLSEQLNISKMYRLYQSWFNNQTYSQENLGTKRQYESIFNTEFNFSFFKPKKDQCAVCCAYEQAEDTKKASMEEDYRAHTQRKNRVREIKREEKASVDSTCTTVAVYDLEKVLNVPQSEVGIFHYKRKYPIYNFTVFDTLKKSGYCYVWHLSVAKRGANEIGSCLLQFIQQERQKGIKNISFYSDGCAGQNKNRFIFAMYMYALKTYGLHNVTHRFFETGHSQSEGDSMHSCIERAMKNKVLYTPEQVYSIILNSKVKGEKYVLKEMDQKEFYDLKSLISGKNWLKDTMGRKILWSKIMELKVSHMSPHILHLKYDFGDDYFQLDIDQVAAKSKRIRRVKNQVDAQVHDRLKQIYHQPNPIPKPLYDDLLGLCTSEAIPKFYHGFYNTLVSGGIPEPQIFDELDEPEENNEEI